MAGTILRALTMAGTRSPARRAGVGLFVSRQRVLLLPSLAGVALASGCATTSGHAGAQQGTGVSQAGTSCEAPAVPKLQSVLYFGQARPGGEIGEAEWQTFLAEEVHTRFPNGLTQWDATGEWRGASGADVKERTKVVLLLNDDTAETREAIEELIARYKAAFQQEAVLWVTSSICAVS